MSNIHDIIFNLNKVLSESESIGPLADLAQRAFTRQDCEARAQISGDLVEVHLKDLETSETQSLTIRFIPSDSGYDIELFDVYIPSRLRGQGYLTSALKTMREAGPLSGRARVSVAINDAWPKILQRAGYEQVKKKIDWPLKEDEILGMRK